jgi:uncharacterized protein (DUF2225 family)
VAEESALKVSYYLKKPTNCPVCSSSFFKEEMLSGGGRLIAKNITDELRRVYEPGKKAGEVNPLLYPVTVCPSCLYAAYQEDFPHIRNELIPIAYSQRNKRKEEIGSIFPDADFKKPRNLQSGAGSYILSIGGYSFHPKERAPSFKKALSSLRAAWTFDDLDKKYPSRGYNRIKLLLYRKAIQYYERTIDYAQSGAERIDAVKYFGPDLDKNYGFQGVLFMFTLLLFKYGEQADIKQRLAQLQAAKRIISRVFGTGKSSKSKPSLVLDLAKELYEKIGAKVEELLAS